MGTPFDAVETRRPTNGDEPAWRDDPLVRHLLDAGRAVSGDGTVVLVDGVPTEVALTRWEAIDAGYAVLDTDADAVRSGAEVPLAVPAPRERELVGVGVGVGAPPIGPARIPAAPASRSRNDVNDWLRAISRNAWIPRPAVDVPVTPIAPVMPVVAAAPTPVMSFPAADDDHVDDGFMADVDARVGDPIEGPAEDRIEGPAEEIIETPIEDPAADVVEDPAEEVVEEVVEDRVEASEPEAEPTVPTGLPAAALIATRGLSKRYERPGGGRVNALESVDVEIRQGEFVTISGASGSGKTTLLYCLSGLEDIDAGEVVVAGEAMHLLNDAEKTALRARTMGFVFQTYHLVEHLTALENVELPLLLNGWSTREARVEGAAMLTVLGLAERIDHLPSELSGGEQQRVAIARALVGDPQVVWADEPTGNLDEETAADVIALLRSRNEAGLTVVLVTHDPGLCARADRRISLTSGRVVGDAASGG